MDQLFEPGATVVFEATATDPDGSITKVEFLDNDESLGIGATKDAKHFSFRSNQLRNGRHVLNAIATDNGGRKTRSNARHIFVNGPIKVRILEPKAEPLIEPGTDLTITAEAIHPSGSIKSVEFFTTGISLGKANSGQDNRFTVVIPKAHRARYSIEAVATDDAGSVSKSALLELKVSKRPTLKIVAPIEASSLTEPVDIELSLNSESSISSFDRVEVYANGALIKESPVFMRGKYSFTWEDAKPGTYILKAVLINDIGARGESPPVKIIIKAR